ncbi:MAG: sigma factor-like helix-turn-helix DNA-binding protein, partial [Balneolaceae bacterium]|nr:sigma factor-like helix-turn-helix DNA-binding protein [Balneolaceae bacterium]
PDTDIEESITGEETPLAGLFEAWIEELPRQQQRAFELSRFEGLTHEEIAEVMEIAPRTVNNHIVAALKTLKERYERLKERRRNVV